MEFRTIALALWGGNYYWTKPEDVVSKYYYVRTHLLENFVSEYYYARTELFEEWACFPEDNDRIMKLKINRQTLINRCPDRPFRVDFSDFEVVQTYFP